MAGDLLVCYRCSDSFFLAGRLIQFSASKQTGNYDVSKMHYEGPGDVPGSTGGGYGYDVRTSPNTVVVQ